MVAVVSMLSIQAEYAASREEYDDLRLRYSPVEATTVISEMAEGFGVTSDATRSDASAVNTAPEPSADLTPINPDYIGWIRIDGTPVDYPVVRGADNEKYLNTSFRGVRRASGTVFMDSACVDGFDAAHAILYGHNMKDGSMFAELLRYTDKQFRLDHPAVDIITPDGETITYRIVAAKYTDVWDAAYSLKYDDHDSVREYFSRYGDSAEINSVLTLSTCIGGNDDHERLLIHAVRMHSQ